MVFHQVEQGQEDWDVPRNNFYAIAWGREVKRTSPLKHPGEECDARPIRVYVQCIPMHGSSSEQNGAPYKFREQHCGEENGEDSKNWIKIAIGFASTARAAQRSYAGKRHFSRGILGLLHGHLQICRRIGLARGSRAELECPHVPCASRGPGYRSSAANRLHNRVDCLLSADD